MIKWRRISFSHQKSLSSNKHKTKDRVSEAQSIIMHGDCLRGAGQPGEEAGGWGDGALPAGALHDAEGALWCGGALGRKQGEDRGDRSEGVVGR
jgi:hypothetical protein